MKYLNAIEQAQLHHRTLKRIILLLSLILALVIYGWIHAQSKIKVEIPPQIPESGLVIQQGEIPKTTVYSFAYYIWQSVNHWQKDGLQDYKQNIVQLSPFLTPTFSNTLIQDYNNLLNDGEVQDRIRLMQGMVERGYDPAYVEYVGHNTWLVHLKMRLTEMINSNDKVVKDVVMNYTLKVVALDDDPKNNPWGLALDGFAESPARVETFV